MSKTAMTQAEASTWTVAAQTPMNRTTNRPTAADLLELFGGPNGAIYPSTLFENRREVVDVTGIDAIPYMETSIYHWLECGGEERILDALAEAAGRADER